VPERNDFDWTYKPQSYWVFKDARQQIQATVKGEVRRGFAGFFGEHVGDEVREDAFLSKPGLAKDERASWGAVHPHFLGGEFLPDFADGEVEIARLVLDSVTQDVISLRAYWRGGRIHYSVRDESEGLFEYRFAQKTSREPLSMGKLVRLVDSIEQGESGCEFPEVSLAAPELPAFTSWLHDFNHHVGGAALDSLQYFVRVSSPFYPELEAWYKAAGEEWYEARRAEYCEDDDWDDDDE
jgi:hypothetical protein